MIDLPAASNTTTTAPAAAARQAANSSQRDSGAQAADSGFQAVLAQQELALPPAERGTHALTVAGGAAKAKAGPKPEDDAAKTTATSDASVSQMGAVLVPFPLTLVGAPIPPPVTSGTVRSSPALDALTTPPPALAAASIPPSAVSGAAATTTPAFAALAASLPALATASTPPPAFAAIAASPPALDGVSRPPSASSGKTPPPAVSGAASPSPALAASGINPAEPVPDPRTRPSAKAFAATQTDPALALASAAADTAASGDIRREMTFAGDLQDRHKATQAAAIHAGDAAPAQFTPAPNAAPVAALDARVGERGWDRGLGDKLVWMAGAKHQVAELHLNPPELGPLKITLTLNHDQASAQFVSAHAQVREAIETAMPRLREMLAGSGITLGSTDVSTGAFGGQAQHEPRTYQVPPAAAAVESGGITRGERVLRHSPGLVDTFA